MQGHNPAKLRLEASSYSTLEYTGLPTIEFVNYMRNVPCAFYLLLVSNYILRLFYR
jgi:hypothetical protein